MPYNQGGGGAKCINLFLFVTTIMFIIDSAIEIKDLKNKINLYPDKKT